MVPIPEAIVKGFSPLTPSPQDAFFPRNNELFARGLQSGQTTPILSLAKHGSEDAGNEIRSVQGE